MSIVLLMANKNEVFLCGDKRITTVKQGIDGRLTDFVYNDQGRKIYKINESIVIGAAGSVGIHEMFWKPAIHRGRINADNQRWEYKDFIRCFDRRLHETFRFVEAEHLSKAQAEFECIIAGIDHGVMKSCIYAIADGREHKVSHTFKDGYEQVSIGIHGYDEVYANAFRKTQGEIKTRVKRAFEQMLQTILQKHNGVSLNYDIEHISV